MSYLLVPNMVAFLHVSLLNLLNQDFVSHLLFESELQLFSRVLVASLTQCNLLLLVKFILHYLGHQWNWAILALGSPLWNPTKYSIAVWTIDSHFQQNLHPPVKVSSSFPNLHGEVSEALLMPGGVWNLSHLHPLLHTACFLFVKGNAVAWNPCS